MGSAGDSVPLRSTDALVVVDVQNDFLPGGALAVPAGEQVLEPINRLIGRFDARALPIFATRDWHPSNHCSFRAHGGPWPAHCVAGSQGAAFAPGLRLPETTHIISKGQSADCEAYSGFQGTDLQQQLRARGCTRIFVAGLATDYCVRATALDAIAAGFAVVVPGAAVRAVNVCAGDGTRSLLEMREAGAAVLEEQR